MSGPVNDPGSSTHRLCPKCQSDDIRPRPKLGDWTCDSCGHAFRPPADLALTPAGVGASTNVGLFISYGRRDAKDLAERLAIDLTTRGYSVWLDTRRISPGSSWQDTIADGLRSAKVVLALMTPHSVRTATGASSPASNPGNPEQVDSVCLGEISYALFRLPPRPVVPVMASTCEPPLAIFHLDYVDMRAWTESPDQYRTGLQRLEEGIRAALAGERRYRSWYHQLDPWDFAAFLYSKRQEFCGRQWLFDRIDAWRGGSQRERALLIKGDPGTGKSAVVAELVHRNPGGQVMAYHCCQWDVPETHQPWRFVRSIAAMIASKHDDYAAQLQEPGIQDALSEASCKSDPGSALEKGLLNPLQRLHGPADGPRYLLIDALDESLVANPGTPTIVDLLASRLDRLPPWLRVVATTRKEPAVLEALRGLRAEELDTAASENLADVRQFIANRLASPALAEKLRQSGRSAEFVVGQLCEKSKGNFLYVQQVLDGVERDLHPLDQLDGLPPGLRGLYAQRFKAQFPGAAEFAPCRRVLDVIAAAQEPLSEPELARASGLDDEAELPAVLLRLSCYLPPRMGSDGTKRFAAYHKSLMDWLTDEERRGQTHTASAKSGHRRLADMCWQEYRQDAAKMGPYALAHAPAHLGAAQRWDDLEQLLCDLAYLETMVAVGQMFTLAAALSSAGEALPAERPGRRLVALLDEALRRDIHFVARHARDYPQALFQCLYNSCWWYDSDTAAGHYRQSPDPKAAASTLPPWRGAGPQISSLMERWRDARKRSTPDAVWVRSLRPPPAHLGTAVRAVLRGHKYPVMAVAYAASGGAERIASGSADGTVRLWDPRSGAELACLQGHGNWVMAVAFSVDGQSLLSASWDKSLVLWDAATGKARSLLSGHDGPVVTAAFVRAPVVANGDRDGAGLWVVSGSHDQTLRLWDAASGETLRILRGHAADVTAVCPLPAPFVPAAANTGGCQILSSAMDQTVRLWDAASGREVSCRRLHGDSAISLSCSPDGRHAAAGTFHGAVWIWGLASDGGDSAGRKLGGHDGAVSAVAYCPDGRRLATGSVDATVRIWDAASGAMLRCLRGHDSRVTAVRWSADGRTIASSSEDGTVRLWRAEGGEDLRPLIGHSGDVMSLAFTPDGSRLLSGSTDGTLRVWSAAGEPLLCLQGHEHWVAAVAGTGDGRWLISGSYDQSVRVWDARDGRPLFVLRGHEAPVRAVSVAADSSLLASGAEDRSVRLWDPRTGKAVASLTGHGGAVLCLAHAPDGRTIASGSADKTVRLWDAGGGELRCLRGHSGHVLSLAWTTDGRWLLSQSQDKTIRQWDPADGRCVRTFGPGEPVLIEGVPGPFIYRPAPGSLETRLADGPDGQRAAWFPIAAPRLLVRAPAGAPGLSGTLWAAAVGAHVHVLQCAAEHVSDMGV